MMVPPVLLLATNSPLVDKYDLSSLRVMGVGAAPVSPPMILACQKRFAKRGQYVSIGQGYGMTELSPVSHYVVPEHARRGKASTVGQLMPNLEARLVASDEGAIVDAKQGEPGELWVRGPIVMKVCTCPLVSL